MNAYMDNSPVIALGGQVPTSLIGNDAFQESDMMGITLPITKHNFQLRYADDIPVTIAKAFKISTEGRPGPVYIDVPKDVQTDECSAQPVKDVKIEGFHPTYRGHARQLAKAAD